MATSVSGIRQVFNAIRVAVRPGSAGMLTRLRALPRMTFAVATNKYTETSLGQLAGLIAAAVYIISPIDLVPESFLGLFGIADDAVVLGWMATTFVNHTEQFLNWESSNAAPKGSSGPRPTGPTSAEGAGGASDQPDVVRSHVVR